MEEIDEMFQNLQDSSDSEDEVQPFAPADLAAAALDPVAPALAPAVAALDPVAPALDPVATAPAAATPATADIQDEDEIRHDVNITCSLCLTNPRDSILPCEHTLCEACVNREIMHQRTNFRNDYVNVGVEFVPEIHIRCYTCRSPYERFPVLKMYLS